MRIVIAAFAGLIVAGCVTTAAPEPAATDVASTSPAPRSHCVQNTGTRIKQPEDKPCSDRPGTSYSKEEIDETGQRDNLGTALQRLDPRVH